MVDFFLDADIKWDEDNADLKRSFLKLVSETKAYVQSVTEDLRLLLGVGTTAIGIGFITEWHNGFTTKIFKLATTYCKNLTRPYLQNLVKIGRFTFPAVSCAAMEAIVTSLAVGFALYLGYKLCPILMDMYTSAKVLLQKIMSDSNTAFYFKQILQYFKTVYPNFVPVELLSLITSN